MKLLSRAQTVAIGLAMIAALPGYAAQELEDLLQASWYEIEIIVFERLPLLDVNSEENLTYTARRSWPGNLMLVRDAIEDQDTLPDSSPEPMVAQVDPLMWESEYCLGYPELEVEDPIHPLLQPVEDELELDVLDAEEIDEDSSTDAATEPSELVADEALPIESDSAVEADLETALESEPEPEPEPEPTAYDLLLSDLTAYEDELWRSSFAWLPELTMQTEVKALNRNRHLRPVLHRRWRQAVPERDAPQPVYLAAEVEPAAPLTRAGFAKIEGYATVTLGRYLHFAPTLWYHADNLGMAPLAVPLNHVSLTAPDPGYMELKESRRMRSAELHYLDHPKFGVIVRIDPVELPEELQLLWSALAEPGDDAP
jgi:hypothetical protein